MKISTHEVRRVATLACLEFDEAGEARMAGEMSRILDYVDEIRDAGGNDEPALPVAPVRLREDEPAESLPAEAVGNAAPRFARGHFVVPKVIGGE
ncbi:MAG: Asp-tRNA(Asn)/Glu-tRNA(Gln) amidotransferase subunit GatC [Thermoanaerobaculia bacterium]|jgi:aspartyl-tRNA(Asn)/glutamyl-tRNA(Gln) amidotransferase subunit C